MKNLFTVLLVAAGFMSVAQVSLFTQPLPLQHHSYDSFSISIKNTDTASHSFYPLTIFDQPGDYYFVDKQSVYDRLIAKGTRIDALYEILRIVKSPAFRNFWIESADDNDSGLIQGLVEKRYAITGFLLGSSAYKCNNFRYFVARTLIDAGIFLPEDVRIVSTDYHQLVEFRIDGKWVGLDADPGEPYAISTFADGTYMSFEEVLQHPENLKRYVWYGSPTDSVVFFPDNDTTEYLPKLQNMVYWPVQEVSPVDISGVWKLCTGSELVWSYKLPRLVDTTEANNKLMYDSTHAAILQHDYTTAGDIIAGWLGFSNGAEAIMAFEQDKIMLTNGTLPNLLRGGHYQNNELVLKVHTEAMPVVLGKDLALPMTISTITTTNPVVVGDTVFPAGYSRIIRYNKKDFTDFMDREEEPVQTAGQFQYLSAGSIPPYTDVEFRLCYNQLMYPFPYGLQVEAFGDAVDKLTVTTTSSGVTGITEVNNKTTNTLPDGIYTLNGDVINSSAGVPAGVYLQKKDNSIKKVSVVR